MAVEFRCPECRAKLRLSEAPEPGEEVECPKCNHVFPAPDVEPNGRPAAARKKTRPADDEADDRPRKKKSAGDGADEDRPAEKKSEFKAPVEQPKEGKRKKRKFKKQKTNKGLLVGVVVGGLVVLGLIVGLLVWYLGRKSAAAEMMAYLPEDANHAIGLNVGHLQKYPEFYKTVERTWDNTTFKRSADALAKALGQDTNDMIDYMVTGFGPSGFAYVLRTKKEFDQGAISKLPGAKSYSADGVTYYTADDVGGAYGGLKVFAPTNRIVVFAQSGIRDDLVKKMLKGNSADPDKTILGRTGPLAKRMTRGTWWIISDTKIAAPPPPAQGQGPLGGGGDNPAEMQKVFSDNASSAKAWGFKASAGSKEIRFELVLWCRDAEAAGELAKKWKESEIAKGDEGEPPRWFKTAIQRFGDRKVGQDIMANIGFTSSGELFVARTAVDTKNIMAGINSVVTTVTGSQAAPSGGGRGGGPPGGPPGGGPGPGGPP